MKNFTRFIKTTITSRLLTVLGAGLLVASSVALAAKEVEPTTQLPKKTVIIKRDMKTTPVPLGTDKKVNSSGNMLGPIGDIIDGGGGSAANMDTVSVSAVTTISPLGLSTTVTPDTSLPLSAWKKVQCNVTTEYFPTITGSQPNNDTIKTTPSLSISNNAVSFACPYKTAAHALNIAKSIVATTDISISHNKNSMTYSYSGFLLHSCTRASKTSAWTCN